MGRGSMGGGALWGRGSMGEELYGGGALWGRGSMGEELYGGGALWGRGSMGEELYGGGALWGRGSMGEELYGGGALWGRGSMGEELYGGGALWGGSSMGEGCLIESCLSKMQNFQLTNVCMRRISLLGTSPLSEVAHFIFSSVPFQILVPCFGMCPSPLPPRATLRLPSLC